MTADFVAEAPYEVLQSPINNAIPIIFDITQVPKLSETCRQRQCRELTRG